MIIISDSCENDGYLEFGEYLPKEVLDDEFLEKWGQLPKTYNEKLLDFIETFNTQHEAEQACQAGNIQHYKYVS